MQSLFWAAMCAAKHSPMWKESMDIGCMSVSVLAVSCQHLVFSLLDVLT